MELPKDFETLMARQLGTADCAALCHALSSTESPTSIRVNTRKNLDYDDKDNIEARVPWCQDGYYLKKRPSFTFDPLLHAGCYYVQEASSMFLSHVLKTYLSSTESQSNDVRSSTDQAANNGKSDPIIALDMCAAPGGKSTLTLSQLPEGSLLIANEVMRQRAQVLAENVTKWGNPYNIVTSNYAEDFLPLGQIFDLIVCDAPCSGEGMFRKDPDSITEWNLSNVDTCWKRQREIISNIWQCLKPGGLFIYSTCTFNSLEDEDNVEWIINELGGEKLPLQDKSEWNISNGHFYPHRTKGEGFFISVIRKLDLVQDDYLPTRIKKKKDKGKKQKTASIPEEIKHWINDVNDFVFYQEKDSYMAFPKAHSELLHNIKDTLHIITAGIEIAMIKGKNLQPAHSLAVSSKINTKAFPIVELSLDDAIAYLRTEAIQVDAPKGYVLLTYKDHPIGFGKNIGNRVNNLYPTEWRIRSSYTKQA